MNAYIPIDHDAWYVIHTKPREEFRAVEHLKNQGYDCFLPTLQVERVRRMSVEARREPLFARYLMIRLNMITSNWAPIRSTRGVNRLVKFGERFATIPDEYVDALKSAPERTLKRLFERGDTVKVATGPFAGKEGIYQALDGDARAMVLIEMMQQPQKLSFAIEMLRKTD